MQIWRIPPHGQENDLHEEWIGDNFPLSQFRTFSDAAFSAFPADEPAPDAVFLSLTGQTEQAFAFAAQLQRCFGPRNIIFTADRPDHAFRAMQYHASGYLLEPLRSRDVLYELGHLRYRFESSPDRRIVIQTFGNFDIWVDGELLHFPRSTAKELLAYLVDRRGGSSTLGEIAAVLWENKERNRSLNSQIQTTVCTLIRVLEDAGVPELLCRTHNALSIRRELVTCDLYSFLEGDPDAIRRYLGEYMRNYSWAEYTAGWLNSCAQRWRLETSP